MMKKEFDSYFAGEIPDLEFHGWGFWGYDFPVALMLNLFAPVGIGYREGDVVSYAVFDATLLVAGTLYWFGVGYFAARLIAQTRPLKTFAAGFDRLRRRGRAIVVPLIAVVLLCALVLLKSSALYLASLAAGFLPPIVLLAGLIQVVRSRILQAGQHSG
jgi:hypothetical protein